MKQAATVLSSPEEGPLGGARPARLGELFDANHLRLYRLARRLSGDAEEARDLVQETFLRLARDAGAIRLDASGAEAWLVRVLVNLCRDRRRRLRVRRLHLAHAVDPSHAGSFESAAVARATVQRALACLPARRRAVVVLHELEDRSAVEIGRLLGIAEVTVRWHLHAARKQLKTFFLGIEESDEG